LMVKKIFQLYFALINQDQCAALSLFKGNIKLKEIKLTKWKILWNSEMDLISIFKVREMLLMLAECNACRLLLINRSLTCKMELMIEN
jgi:hypothetical protein